MPSEEVPNCRPGHTLGAYLPECPQNFVSKGIAHEIAEYVGGRRLAVLPNRQCGSQMVKIDLNLAVEQGINHRDPDSLSLCACRNAAEQAGTVRRQYGIDFGPLVLGGLGHRHATDGL